MFVNYFVTVGFYINIKTWFYFICYEIMKHRYHHYHHYDHSHIIIIIIIALYTKSQFKVHIVLDMYHIINFKKQINSDHWPCHSQISSCGHNAFS